MVSLKKIKIILLLSITLSGTALLGNNKVTFHDNFILTAKDFKSEDLIKFKLTEDWTFIPFKVAENWQNNFQNGIKFQLKNNSIDLDSVVGKTCKAYDKGVVYNKIYSDKDGLAVLGLGADWWFEAYINGELVYSTFPNGNEANDYDYANHKFLISLKKGENLLAIKVQRGDFSWFFGAGSIDSFVPALPILTYKPILGHVDNNQMSVSFSTFGKIGAGVEYRIAGSKEWQLKWDSVAGQIKRSEFHKVFLDKLTPGAEYEYRIVLVYDSRSGGKFIYPENGKIYRFKLPAENTEEFSFFFTADLQYQLETQKKVLGSLLKATDADSCDFLILGGDMANYFIVKKLFSGVFSTIVENGGSYKPTVVVRGNHETRGDESDRFIEIFGDNKGRAFRIFRYGKTAFLILDAFEDKKASLKDYTKFNLDELYFTEEAKYLAEAINSPEWQSAEKRIVLSHGATYSHNSTFMSNNLQELTDKYFAGKNPISKINLFLAGHTHKYGRSLPGTSMVASFKKLPKASKSGIDYTYPVFTVAGPNEDQPISASAFRVDVKKEKITVSAFDVTGKCFEKVELFADGKVNEIISLKYYDISK